MGTFPQGTFPDGLFAALLGDLIGFISVGVFYRVRAARWHRILSRCQWQEISYRYSEQVQWTYTSKGSHKSWLPTLSAESLTEPGKSMVLSLSAAGTRLGWWRLRAWRQVPTGVAWLAGDPSHRVIVAPPGPGRLFSAKYSSRTPASPKNRQDSIHAA